MNSTDCGHQAPLVSMAFGTKECMAARATYFVVLLTAAFSACLAFSAVVEVSYRCNAAYVSGTVTSQASDLPRVNGTRVAPLGLLPSDLDISIGSSLAGICAFLTARQIRSMSCYYYYYYYFLKFIYFIFYYFFLFLLAPASTKQSKNC